MAYTKREIGQRLINLLYPTPTEDAKLTLQEAMKAVCEARDAYVKFNTLQAKAQTSIVLGNWLSEFHNISVNYDEGRKAYYSDLPAGVISLPSDRGVYHVYFTGGEEDMFIAVTPAMRNRYKGSLAQFLEGDYGYYLLEDRIWYVQNMPEDCRVSMHLVAQSADLGETDYFPLDGSAIQEVLERALQLVAPTRGIPQDLTNDNVSQ